MVPPTEKQTFHPNRFSHIVIVKGVSDHKALARLKIKFPNMTSAEFHLALCKNVRGPGNRGKKTVQIVMLDKGFHMFLFAC